ncbi:MAG: TetR family transcriptional regulator [Deltaproteobacteria bacterium]|nr:TetR family transcriptional regulator [Deltaproteobacteria bacterium]
MPSDARDPAVADDFSAPRLALSQLGRVRRIVDAAIELAEAGGFDGVRLRDVAEASGVALGTLYKYFRSKEDVLLFAVNEDTAELLRVMAERPPRARNAHERVAELFARATRGLTRRPNFARAVVRAIATADASSTAQQAAFHLRMTRMVVAALRGEAADVAAPLSEAVGTERERRIALVLQNVWFASLVGWASGLHPIGTVTQRVEEAVELALSPRE